MLKNYLKTAWRSLLRNKAHTAINLIGLSVGLTCGLLILLWVQSEVATDAYHANGAQLYKLYEVEYYDNKVDGNYDTPAPMAEELKKVIPEIQYAASEEEINSFRTLSAAGKQIKVDGMLAGGDLFKLFSYTLVQGTPSSALASPVSIALSEKTARLFFGDAATAMGKTIRCEDRIDLMVTGVYKDPGERDSRKFDYVINWDVDYKFYPSNKLWGNSGPLTFVMLRRDADTALVNKKLKHFIDKYNPPGPGYHNEYALQRFDQVYLHGRFDNGRIAGGRIEYVRLFSIVAVFILLMACVNFMNLTTARSVKRAREIGVRKVMGAMRGALIRQFIGESLLLTVVAVIVSLGLMTLVLPLFNGVTQKQLSLPFSSLVFWGRLALLTIITGVIAGCYPALFLSSFNPVVVLKGMLKLNMGAVWFRKGLVVFQFTLSAMLIIATIVVSRQVHYIQRMDLGYDRENLIYIPIEGNLATKYEVFKSEALRLPEVAAVSRTSSRPTFMDNSTTAADWDGKRSDQVVSFSTAEVDQDFLSTMGLKLVAGRDYSRAFAADTNNYIINELAREKLGYKDPIGRSFTLWGVKGKIIGLLGNFHFASLHDPMQPLVIKISTNHFNGDDILVRIKPGGTSASLARLEELCRQLNPAFPFSYNFSDEEFQKLYKAEQVAGRLANIFAGLAILISCLGLLGLAMFTAEQRVKEIGIRKVLGAGVLSLFGLLSIEFLGLVGLAFLIASPLAWLAMNGWLQGYAYHMTMAWWIFVLAGSIVLVIALLTVSFQALKASMANPMKSLRSE